MFGAKSDEKPKRRENTFRNAGANRKGVDLRCQHRVSSKKTAHAQRTQRPLDGGRKVHRSMCQLGNVDAPTDTKHQW